MGELAKAKSARALGGDGDFPGCRVATTCGADRGGRQARRPSSWSAKDSRRKGSMTASTGSIRETHSSTPAK